MLSTIVCIILTLLIFKLLRDMNVFKIIGIYSYLLFDIIREFYKNVFRLRQMCESKERLIGKVVVITGANTGIGKETVYLLSLRGPKIIIGCRDLEKAENAVKEIKAKNPTANITFLKLDLSSLTSVRQFIKSVEEKVNAIDILINNAGVMTCPEWQTEDGFEMQFGTNYLAHFVLTLSLIPLMKNSLKARVITVSSMLYVLGQIDFENINLRGGAYAPLKAYAQSKLALILFTRELAKRLGPDSNIKTYCLHPGIIFSDLSRHLAFGKFNTFVMRMLYLNLEMGAQTTLYCALDKSIENESGYYYADCKRRNKLMAIAEDITTGQRLWDLSCDLVKLNSRLNI